MGKILSENIRNIAIIGHSGEGKTSLAEAILFNGKTIDRLGKTTDKNTVIRDGRNLSGHESMPFYIGKGVMV